MIMTTFLKALWLVALFNGHPVTLFPVESGEFAMRQGWYECQTVWYVPFAASNQLVARQFNDFTQQSANRPANGVEWTPALDCALENDMVNNVYIINCAQTVIFDKQPDDSDYTGLWQVHYLEWIDDADARPLCSASEVLLAIAMGELEEQGDPSVMDATIIVPTSGIPSVELASLDYKRKLVRFYAFPVFYFNKVDKIKAIEFIIAPDISDEDLAERLGANWAPRLANGSPDCCGCISAIENPVPPGQLPIICEIPEDICLMSKNNNFFNFGGVNPNLDYNPVLCWNIYERTGLAPYSVVNSDDMLQHLVGLGLLTNIPLDPPIVTNSPVIIRYRNANGG